MLSDRDRLLRMYRERVAAYQDADDGFRDRWSAWCRMVLAYGGELVVPPLRPEPDLDWLLADGMEHGPQVRVVSSGGDCHGNVAKLWIDGKIDVIGTGYALFEGLWRQHSWGVGDGDVLETKWLCERYVGVVLPAGEQTVRFALSNFDGDVKQVLQQRTGRADEIVQVLQAVRRRRLDGEQSRSTSGAVT
ncbi:hypothetical protein [Catellatospora chokoriensis]|uniref:hypothetical protein n=2 Tax=Catellatospora chokoriensis TaxID=310353 RepID=UPI0017858AFF|nr:hypothetical protein [Catellatospora chokoriensis]